MIRELDVLKTAIQFEIDTLKREIEEVENEIDEGIARKVDKSIIGVGIGMKAEKERTLEWLEKLRGEK